ncbi:nodulin-related protein 1-like [Iris pallida]|uniref:Nodulin-related protein 1-like n=1 Tax=Iris pallida TaxID=29817 RepID=A0AAX6I1F9_IRIPA|nr:nodulin-related protein 1-like [Iris pallida]
MEPSHHGNYNQHPHTHKASPTTLLSSAKVIAEAAQSTLRHDAHGYDKAKAAGAAADLLCAGSHYAKLDESGYGKYVQKAENYLHQYNNHSSSAPSHSSSAHPGGAAATAHGGSAGGGGYGDYMKMAQGFLGHSSTNGHGSGEGGYGEYVKMAQGFLKKH